MKYTVTVNFEVAECWIQDGFDLTSESSRDRIKAFFEEDLLPSSAAGIETSAQVKVKKLRR